MVDFTRSSVARSIGVSRYTCYSWRLIHFTSQPMHVFLLLIIADTVVMFAWFLINVTSKITVLAIISYSRKNVLVL